MIVTLVGVLNITPDSFSDGGEFLRPEGALAQAAKLLQDGAKVVDIGAEATNPWASPISPYEEWVRLEPVVAKLLPAYPDFTFSIDTRHPQIVERASKFGKFIVNDVTTFIDPEMISVTAHAGLMSIASHLPLEAGGDIARAHREIKLEDENVVRDELLQQKAAMVAGGIAPEQIILDPGIGFGKSMRLNWKLLEFPRLIPDEKVLIGFSRKRFLITDRQTGVPVEGSEKTDPKLNIEAAKIAIRASAQPLWLRVHDPVLYLDLAD